MTATRPLAAAAATSAALPGPTATLPIPVPKESSEIAEVTIASTTSPLSRSTTRAVCPRLASAGSANSTTHQAAGTSSPASVTDESRIGSPAPIRCTAEDPTEPSSNNPAGTGRSSVLAVPRVSPAAISVVAKRRSTDESGRNSTQTAVAAMRIATNHRPHGGVCSQITIQRYEGAQPQGRGLRISPRTSRTC